MKPLTVLDTQYLRDLKYRLKDSNINFSDKDTLIHIITDCTAVVDPKIVGKSSPLIEYYAMHVHIERYKRLNYSQKQMQ